MSGIVSIFGSWIESNSPIFIISTFKITENLHLSRSVDLWKFLNRPFQSLRPMKAQFRYSYHAKYWFSAAMGSIYLVSLISLFLPSKTHLIFLMVNLWGSPLIYSPNPAHKIDLIFQKNDLIFLGKLGVAIKYIYFEATPNS